MKKMLIGVLLLPVLSFANEEPVIVDKPVVCASTKTLLEGLKKEHNETPIWIGQEEGSSYSLFVSKTGSWTLVQFDRRNACIIGAGDRSQQIHNGPKT